MITHYIEEAVNADRVFVMDKGSVVAHGSPHEVLVDVETLRAAGLEPPFAVQLWADLQGKGYVEETPRPLTLEEAARFLGDRLAGAVPGTALTGPSCVQPPKGREALVELDDVSFAYGTDQPAVLDAVSLGIAAGEFVGVVGRTGCGKSTLVQLIAGLLEPSKGAIRLDGDDINVSGYDRIRLRRRVGMVFQYPEMQLFEQTVYKDVAFGFKQLGLRQSECDERVRWALHAVGFDPDDVLEKSPLGLSGGEKRRVAIAGVLAVRPEVLILDEPVAGLDPKGRVEFMQLLSRLNGEGTTIIMVSHNADCLAAFANRIVVMDAGRIVRDASPQEAYADVEMLHALGIGASQARELAWMLAKEGVNVGAPASYPELFERLAALFAG
jgi:energy-coupling factor transport system ATP-binding protein